MVICKLCADWTVYKETIKKLEHHTDESKLFGEEPTVCEGFKKIINVFKHHVVIWGFRKRPRPPAAYFLTLLAGITETFNKTQHWKVAAQVERSVELEET